MSQISGTLPVWDKDGKLFSVIVPANKEDLWKRLMD